MPISPQETAAMRKYGAEENDVLIAGNMFEHTEARNEALDRISEVLAQALCAGVVSDEDLETVRKIAGPEWMHLSPTMIQDRQSVA